MGRGNALHDGLRADGADGRARCFRGVPPWCRTPFKTLLIVAVEFGPDSDVEVRLIVFQDLPRRRRRADSMLSRGPDLLQNTLPDTWNSLRVHRETPEKYSISTSELHENRF